MEKVQEQNKHLNLLWSIQDGIYHEYAARCGLSAAAFWVLYSLCETKKIYTQNMLASMWCFPKQTVNSAITTLVKMSYVELEQITGSRNSKAVKLTAQGLNISNRMIQPLINAELRALQKMTNQEREQFLNLIEKQTHLLQTEIDLIYQDETIDFKSSKEVNKQ